MFESPERLAGQIGDLLDAIRLEAAGRYACLLGRKGILFESAAPDWREHWSLRRRLEERAAAVFTIPDAMASGAPIEDVFEGWDEDEFFLAVINGRVALVVACPEAEPLREKALRPLQALADRLFRYDGRYRMDERGRGFFFGRPRVDMVVIGRSSG